MDFFISINVQILIQSVFDLQTDTAILVLEHPFALVVIVFPFVEGWLSEGTKNNMIQFTDEYWSNMKNSLTAARRWAISSSNCEIRRLFASFWLAWTALTSWNKYT